MKNFKGTRNPVMEYISSEEEIAAAAVDEAAGDAASQMPEMPEMPEISETPVRYYAAKPSIDAETKTKRVQVVLRPSTYNKAKRAASYVGVSLNEWINRVLEKEAHSIGVS